MRLTNIISATLLLMLIFTSCEEPSTEKLPFIGQHSFVDGDTIFYKIPAFDFVNQDSVHVRNENLADYIYVSDFFFTSCPSICPKVKKQMLRVYKKYEADPLIKLVSHTLDPKRDNTEVLKTFSGNLGVNTDKWMFLTGDKDELREMALKYFVAVVEDKEAPGGLDHSGKIIVVDKAGHVRAFAEGTDPDDVTELMKEIDQLIAEYKAPK